MRVDGRCFAFSFLVYLCFLDIYKLVTIRQKYNYVQTDLLQFFKKYMISLLVPMRLHFVDQYLIFKGFIGIG